MAVVPYSTLLLPAKTKLLGLLHGLPGISCLSLSGSLEYDKSFNILCLSEGNFCGYVGMILQGLFPHYYTTWKTKTLKFCTCLLPTTASYLCKWCHYLLIYQNQKIKSSSLTYFSSLHQFNLPVLVYLAPYTLIPFTSLHVYCHYPSPNFNILLPRLLE